MEKKHNYLKILKFVTRFINEYTNVENNTLNADVRHFIITKTWYQSKQKRLFFSLKNERKTELI